MAVPSGFTGPLQTLGPAVWTSPGLLILGLLTVAIVVIVYAKQPPIPETVALAIVPWALVGSILSVVASRVEYPVFLEPALVHGGGYLIAIAIPGAAMIALLNLGSATRTIPAYPEYLGALGWGTTTVLLGALVLGSGTTTLSRLLIPLFVGIIAMFGTAAVSLAIAYLSPDFIVNTRISGSFVVFGWLIYGMATVTTLEMYGESAHTVFSSTVQTLVITLFPTGILGISPTQLWVWAFILANIAIGVHVAIQLAPLVDRSPHRVYALQSIIGLAGLVLGLNRLVPLMVV